MRRGAALAAAALVAAAGAPPAEAAQRCLVLGTYEDAPLASLGPLEDAVGRLGAMQVYVSAAERVPAGVLARADRDRKLLVAAWLPVESGRVRRGTPVDAIARGRYDAGLRRLVRQLVTLRRAPILRPLPEPNAQWHPWSRAVHGSTAAGYRAAFRHVAAVVRSVPGGRRVRILWSPSARSYPDIDGNAPADFFPGRAVVDLVGASAVNVGEAGGHTWEGPGALLAGGLAEIAALDPSAPVWIAETGTVEGSGKAAWIRALGRLRSSVPRLAGVLWYDVRDGIGDFRIRSSAASTAAFRLVNRGRCA